MRFRRGAFVGEKRIKPVVLKYNYNHVSPAYEVVEFWPVAALTMCSWRTKCEVYVLPDFEPNEYLFEKHKN